MMTYLAVPIFLLIFWVIYEIADHSNHHNPNDYENE